MGLAGLTQINLELTSRCDKACSFCGHQDLDVNKKLEFGDLSRHLLYDILYQIPDGIIVQFHRDGEPLIYPSLDLALGLYNKNHITSIVTNGKQLVKRAEEIIENCNSLTVSAFHGDPDGPEQLSILREFLRIKGDRKPMVLVKWVGDKFDEEYSKLGVPIIRRQLHNPDGNYHYAHRDPPIPEHGICLDLLHHPSVAWNGDFFICNRLSPGNEGLVGNLNEHSLDELWNSKKRLEWLEMHKRGRRDLASPLCRDCKFYGIPTEA